MHTLRRSQLGSFSLAKMACIIVTLCAATAMTSHAQTLTTLYSFCSQPHCTDGAVPLAVLVQAADGNFYGTTYEGGTGPDSGTVFTMAPDGTLTTLYSFAVDGPDGDQPYAGLVQGTDGNFYGTTSSFGAYGGGTVFKITPSGKLTTLHNFCSQPNCTDGTDPAAALVQATDGNFYGTTDNGGTGGSCSGGCGTVFKITPSGTLTTLHSFNGADGAQPRAGLVQATDGNFYGDNLRGRGEQ